MQIIQKEKIPREVDKISLVVAGVLDRREALAVFSQEYSAPALRTRRRKLKSPDVTLELVSDDDYWAISLRCWWDGERNRPMIQIFKKGGFYRITTLRRALRQSTKRKRFDRIYEDMADRAEQIKKERERGEW